MLWSAVGSEDNGQRNWAVCMDPASPSPALPSPYIVLIIMRIQCVLVQYITVVIGMLCTAFHID